MQTPDTPAGAATERIMEVVHGSLRTVPTHAHNEIYSAVLKELTKIAATPTPDAGEDGERDKIARLLSAGWQMHRTYPHDTIDRKVHAINWEKTAWAIEEEILRRAAKSNSPRK